MKKILVLDDNEKLLRRLMENIKKFDVSTAKSIEEALKIIEKEEISFIAVDYDLGNDKTGDILYELLFRSGKSIPAIVFSGKDLSEGTKKFLDNKGFSKILSKVDREGTVSEIVEKAAIEILEDCKERVYQVRQKAKSYGVGEHPLKFGEFVKTVDEWIKEVEDCKHVEDEPALKELIVKLCLKERERQDDYGFPQ